MTIEKILTKNRRPVNPKEIQQFLATIDPQDQEDTHFVVRKMSLYIADIIMYRDILDKPNKKSDLLEALDLDTLGAIEQQLFDERRRLAEQYLIDKMNDIKDYVETEIKDRQDNNIDIFLGITDILISAIQDECFTLAHLSSLERQRVINTLCIKYTDMPKRFIHRIRHTMDSDLEMIKYINGELLWIKSVFIENISDNNSLYEYFGAMFEIWENLIDVKNLHTQYQEYVIDSYSEQIESCLRRKENDRKGTIKKVNDIQSSNIDAPKNQVIQRYNHQLQVFINHFFPEHFLLHKDLQRIYRNNQFFYKDDLANRLNIDQLSPDMELFCEEHGIVLAERQREILPLTSNDSAQQIVEKEPVSKSNTIESRLCAITGLSLEYRVGEYMSLFKEVGYSFIKEEEFYQRILEICRSNIAIEKSIKKILKDIINGIEETKKIGRDFYTFQLYNGCRIVLPKKGEILSIGSHDRYETFLKNNF